MQKFMTLCLVALFLLLGWAYGQTVKPKIRKDIRSASADGITQNPSQKIKIADWRCLGPTGMPNVVASSNTYGHGQINRLAFDPRYDGENNHTIYGCSFFGGLWRSEDDGDNWHNVNTDFLPSTSVADVCVNPFNPEQIFICTGYGDGGIFDARGPNWAHINPLYSTGVFRSDDYGESWKNISGNFLDFFPEGGMCRKMAINPLNPDQIVIASTHGVIKTENATARDVVWKHVFGGVDAELWDVRGIAYKPGDANTIYASGKDIFISEDGGNTWESLTGEKFRMDLKNLPDSFQVRRINIAVTPADPERLYAYILGEKDTKNRTFMGAHIALFEENKWRIIETRFTSGLTYFADNWIAIAVSPVDADAVFYANTRLIGSENIDSIKFGLRSPYCGNGFHADVHDLAFQPNVENPKLFAANHGGVSVKIFPNPNNKGWAYKNEGLQVATIWAFDDSEIDEELAIIGLQDNGTLFRYDTLGNMWHFIYGGDGGASRINPNEPHKLYFSPGDKSLLSFDMKTFKRKNEATKLPFDPRDKKDRIGTSKTTAMVNHPETGRPWFGFTELYSKELNEWTITNKPEEIWKLQSDIHKTEPFQWRRQITEIEFCKARPDNIYVVTGGQQNSPWFTWHLPSVLYKSTTGGINGEITDEKQFVPVDYPGMKHDDDTLAIITSIAVAPFNPDHVWITYTGIPGEFRVWFSYDGGETWRNADPDGMFENNPVNAIAYQEGSADRIYLGTDRGLYTKNRFTGWEKVEGFPNVRITELKINYAFNKLRVATFGRGLWEGELLK